MKKILLILAVFAAFQVNAQNHSLKVDQEAQQFINPNSPLKTHPKSKTRGTRTYSYITAIDAVHYGGTGILFGGTHSSALPMWGDSTVQVRYNTGYGSVNFNSAASVLDPVAPIYHSSPTYTGEMAIGPNDAYTVDSIILWGFYMTPNSDGAVTGDRLTISVVTGDGSSTSQIVTYQRTAGSGNSVQVDYLDPIATADNSIRGRAPEADSVARIAGTTAADRISWDYNFTNADTSAPSNATNPAYLWKRFAFAPPSPINVAAGQKVAVSFTFKSGDTWLANQDSLSFFPGAGSKNHFRPRFYEETVNDKMTYRNNSENDGGDANGSFKGGDFNNSSLMFTTSESGFYDPTVRVEEFNQPSFSYEHLDVDWVVTCNACLNTTSTNDIMNELKGINVYPNPATDQMNIALEETASNDVTVSLYTMTGQKLISDVVEKGSSSITLDVASLSKGMYLVEFESDGQTYTQKVSKK